MSDPLPVINNDSTIFSYYRTQFAAAAEPSVEQTRAAAQTGQGRTRLPVAQIAAQYPSARLTWTLAPRYRYVDFDEKVQHSEEPDRQGNGLLQN
jgi:hypothetical protein